MDTLLRASKGCLSTAHSGKGGTLDGRTKGVHDDCWCFVELVVVLLLLEFLFCERKGGDGKEERTKISLSVVMGKVRVRKPANRTILIELYEY